MIVLASVLIALLAVAIVNAERGAIRRSGILERSLQGIQTALTPQDQPSVEDLRVRLESAERAIDDLPRSWEKERRDAQSAEARARHHAGRAIAELEARGLTSPGLEVVADELFEKDDGAGDGEPVPAVHEGVALEIADDDWLAQTQRKRYG